MHTENTEKELSVFLCAFFPWLACAQSRTKISPYTSTPSNRFSRMNQPNFGNQDKKRLATSAGL